jgi:two-component system, response regulator PdtaR
MSTGSQRQIIPVTILVAVATDVERATLREALRQVPRFSVVAEVSPSCDLAAAVRRLRPDVVILDLQRAELGEVSRIDELRAIHETVAVIPVITEFNIDVASALAKPGVFASLTRPARSAQVVTAVLVGAANARSMHSIMAENRAIRRNLQNRDTIEQAMSFLMVRSGWSEPETFRRLQRAAMHGRISLADMATRVLNGEVGKLELEALEQARLRSQGPTGKPCN